MKKGYRDENVEVIVQVGKYATLQGCNLKIPVVNQDRSLSPFE